METILEKKELLRKFATRTLTDSEMEMVIAYLRRDEAAIEILEDVWREEQASSAPKPTLNEQKARRLEERIMSQLNRAQFTTNMITLGTRGFWASAAGLLRPFLSQ